MAQVGEVVHPTTNGPSKEVANVENGSNCPITAKREPLGTEPQIGVKNELPDICMNVFPPVEDKVGFWARVAASLYAEDGETDGWDSDKEDLKLTSEEKYIQVGWPRSWTRFILVNYLWSMPLKTACYTYSSQPLPVFLPSQTCMSMRGGCGSGR